MGSRILVFPSLKELEEFLRAALLKEAHEGTADGLHLVTWDLGDLAITVDEAACNLLEFKIAGNIGVDENLGELSRGNDELGDEINCVVTIPAEFLRRRLVWAELAVELDTVVNQSHGTSDKDTYLSEVETGAVTTVVVIPVHVQDLLALDGQQAGQDTLRQTGTKHDVLNNDLTKQRVWDHCADTYIVFFIHCSSSDMGRGVGSSSREGERSVGTAFRAGP